MTQFYEFGQWEFDLESGELTRNKQSQSRKRLEPQIAKVLAYFLDNQKRVISRDELIEALWDNRVVSDDVINRCIFSLRKTLTPEEKSKYIETVPRKGYRAHFPDKENHSSPSQNMEEDDDFLPHLIRQMQNQKRRMIPVFIMIAITIEFFWPYLPTLAPYFARGNLGTDLIVESTPVVKSLPVSQPGIAILPFTILADSNKHDPLGAGIAGSVIHLLAQVDGIKVIAETSSRAMSQRGLSISELATALKVDTVLEGSVQRSGEKVRIFARLVDVQSNAELWSRHFDRQQEDIFEIQDEIAREIVVSFQKTLKGIDDFEVARVYQPEYSAYLSYLSGKDAHNTETRAGYIEAISHFQDAMNIDPQYTLPYIAQATSYLGQADRSDRSQAQEKATQLANDALDIDPLMTSAHLILARIQLEKKNFERAQRLFLRAMNLSPNNAEANMGYAMWFYLQARYEEALPYARKAISFDPGSSLNQITLAIILWSNSKSEEAISIVNYLVATYPEQPSNFAYLSRWTLQMGQPGKALYYAHKELESDPESPSAQRRLCEMQFHLWDKAASLQCYKDYLEIHPENFDALLAIDSIKHDCNAAAKLLATNQVAGTPMSFYRKNQYAHYLSCLKDWPKVIEVLESVTGLENLEELNITDNNIWSARMLGQALIKQKQVLEGKTILNAALTHIERSRKLQAAGFISGIEDVFILSLLERRGEALVKLEEAIESGWSFYTTDFYLDENLQNIREDAKLIELTSKLRHRMAKAGDWYQDNKALALVDIR